MSRLIDADKLERVDFSECMDSMEIMAIIDAQPTAYDVDKVVEQLEKNGQKMSEEKSNRPYGKYLPGCHNYYKAISVKKAVEIVKGGGIDG